MENLHKPSTSIKNWAMDDRPREKMITKGAAALSNAELLTILINTGNKHNSALELGKNVLQICHNNLNELGKISIKELQKVKGIGIAKAICIAKSAMGILKITEIPGIAEMGNALGKAKNSINIPKAFVPNACKIS